MIAPELAFAEKLASLLGPFGEASLEYITAEMQPFSNMQRPDVIWKPSDGGYAGQLVFFEIKMSSRPVVLGQVFKNLIANLEFASEALEHSVGRYLFITSATVPEFSHKLLSDNRVHAVANVIEPETVLLYLRELGALT